MMGIALVVDVMGVHPDDRAADAPGLGIPAYAITDLEGFGRDGSVQPKQTSASLWRSPRSHCCRSQRLPAPSPRRLSFPWRWKAALAEHENIIRHVADRGDLFGRNAKTLDRVATTAPCWLPDGSRRDSTAA